jgi:hypothetical protein
MVECFEELVPETRAERMEAIGVDHRLPDARWRRRDGGLRRGRAPDRVTKTVRST